MTTRTSSDNDMKPDYIKQLFQYHQEAEHIPSPDQVCGVLDGLLQLLFPEFSDQRFDNLREFEQQYNKIRLQLFNVLDIMADRLPDTPEAIEAAFIDRLVDVRALLMKDANAILAGDPAATDLTEVIRTYPGFQAVAVYRLAHEFYKLNVPLIPRILTEDAHGKTGIDIHPGAKIGAYFCIDHGTGLVIGETVEIGDHVKMYQGVTLGALSVRKEMAQTKRHPTIEDHVVIYANVTILGGETIIGHHSTIGGNVWITKSIPPHSKIYYKAYRGEDDGEEAEPVQDR